MPSQETLFSIVNRWECDENDHLNVQFYFQHFDEADRQFRLISGLNETLVGIRRVRHVRFHKDLRLGDLLTVQSSVVFDGPYVVTVLHELRNGGSGGLCATAIDGYEPSEAATKTLRPRFEPYESAMSDEAKPRTIDACAATNRVNLETLTQKHVPIIFRGTVLPENTEVDGRASDRFALACCANGIAHLWKHTPLAETYLSQNRMGCVAVEMKITWSTPLKTGDMLVIASGFTGAKTKAFCLRHHIFESRTSRLAATIDAVLVTMDMEKRSAIALPPEAHQCIATMLLES